jgi:hypothetical protein
VRSLEGACAVFERPPYVIKGKQRVDQDWIDDTIESGVGACGWERPKPRPTAIVLKAPAKR